MYIPRYFEEKNPEFVEEFIGEFPFAELISVQNTGRIVATHIPVIIIETKPEMILAGHISAANKMHQGAENNESLIIFREPHAYISPKHYDEMESVPTWNYAAIHLHGKIKWVESREKKLELMQISIKAFEPEYLEKFENLSHSYIEKMLMGIVGFHFHVDSVEAKRKLSQNKNEAERNRIIETLSNGSDLEKKISDMMK